MAAANIQRISKQIVQLLNARPSDVNYSATPSGKNGAFPSAQEITDAILAADARVVIEGYLSVQNHALRNGFLTPSANLASGSQLPSFIGSIGRVDLSDDAGTTWRTGVESFKDDVLMARSLIDSPIPFIDSAAAKGYYAIAEDSIFHTSDLARIYLPQFTKSATDCQAHEGHESAIIAATMAALKKNNSNAEHDYFAEQFTQMLPLIRQGATEVRMNKE